MLPSCRHIIISTCWKSCKRYCQQLISHERMVRHDRMKLSLFWQRALCALKLTPESNLTWTFQCFIFLFNMFKCFQSLPWLPCSLATCQQVTAADLFDPRFGFGFGSNGTWVVQIDMGMRCYWTIEDWVHGAQCTYACIQVKPTEHTSLPHLVTLVTTWDGWAYLYSLLPQGHRVICQNSQNAVTWIAANHLRRWARCFTFWAVFCTSKQSPRSSSTFTDWLLELAEGRHWYAIPPMVRPFSTFLNFVGFSSGNQGRLQWNSDIAFPGLGSWEPSMYFFLIIASASRGSGGSKIDL